MRTFVFIALLLAPLFACSQDSSGTILMMNGRVINARILGQSTFGIRYELQRRNGVFKEQVESTADVFSVVDSTGKEKVWYFYDPAFGNELTVPQMRSYIKGEQDARKGYDPLWTTLGGFAFGAATTVLMESEVVSFVYPAVYAGVMILPRVHVQKGTISDITMEGNEDYAYGYAQVGRSRRIVRALISTFIGVGAGLAITGLQ